MIRWILGYILGLVACATISIYGVYVGWWIWESEYIDIYDVGVLLMAGWTFMYMSITIHQEIKREKGVAEGGFAKMKDWKFVALWKIKERERRNDRHICFYIETEEEVEN